MTAKKEVILSAGSLDSPRLLMLSGVGPQADLRAHGIEVVKDLDGVGKEFADHPTVVCAFHMGPGFTRRMHTTEHYQEALEEMNKYGTGPLLEHFSSSPQAFLKAENMYDSEEFQNLEKDVQEMMRQPDTPNYEIIVSTHGGRIMDTANKQGWSVDPANVQVRETRRWILYALHRDHELAGSRRY